MKAKTLSAAVALGSLLTFSGTVFAADAHDGYRRAFSGQASPQSSATEPSTDTMGKAAYGTQSDTSAWSGHEAYGRAFLGKTPSKPEADTIGKAAYGTSDSGMDGNTIYHGAFRGD